MHKPKTPIEYNHMELENGCLWHNIYVYAFSKLHALFEQILYV